MKNRLNLGIFAHVDAGKTSLTERILFSCGALRSLGSVDNGTAQTDRMSLERERGISIRAASASVDCGNIKLNIIDTPGHTDFAGECERALGALDMALVVVSAVEGVQPHTESLWYAIRRKGLPVAIFINKLDRAGADYSAVLSDLTRMDTVNRPSEAASVTFAPLVAPTTEVFDYTSLTEALADVDDDIAEAFLDGDMPDDATLTDKMCEYTSKCALVPVLCGSAKLGDGIEPLTQLLSLYGERYGISGDGDKLSAYVYKLEHDAMFGHLAQVRVFDGVLRARDILTPIAPDGRSREGDKATLLRGYSGAKLVDTPEVRAGEIAAVYGLKNVRPGDFLGEVYGDRLDTALANPYLTVGLTPESPEKLTPLVEAVTELSEEEPRLGLILESSTRELSINVSGEVQIEIIAALLKERFGLSPIISPPTVIYRETPTKSGIGFEAYTMPKPCWAVVELKLDPLPNGSGVIFDEGNVPHNQLFYKYQSHIKTSFFDSLKQGIKGWEVTDFKATLIGGEHHVEHTHPLDFFVATPVAFLNGLTNCGTTFLEPMLSCRITLPEEHLGKLLGDITTTLRGEFDSPTINAGSATLECLLPVATSFDYPVKLASYTSGRARFFSKFDSWRPCPDVLARTTPYRGVCPLDRARWILYARGAFRLAD